MSILNIDKMRPISEIKDIFNKERIIVEYAHGYKTTGVYDDGLILLDANKHNRVWSNTNEFKSFMVLSEIGQFNKMQIAAYFSRLLTNGVFHAEDKDGRFKPERNFNVSKKLLNSHFDMDFDSIDYSEFDKELHKVLYKEKQSDSTF